MQSVLVNIARYISRMLVVLSLILACTVAEAEEKLERLEYTVQTMLEAGHQLRKVEYKARSSRTLSAIQNKSYSFQYVPSTSRVVMFCSRLLYQ